ncbi:phosphotransferase enzyme family protein [Bifidobacterium choloepi]|uniref:Phosphotransferase n=1 Tax=Bifidobacterium choloepi TaxID=2614131 RepID=A0A6I5N1P0_9BIFI|nr:phosphotransferase [Bifidobacterium choloepi]NEG70537.1 phosphotransferase [Bifidobacterium choloepi]
MSVFEDTSIFDDVANEAIRAYPLGDQAHARLLQLSENATYLVEDADGLPEGILRVGRPGYHTLEEYRSEMAWLRQINDYTPLVVANPLPASDGTDIQVVRASDGNEYFCVMTEFLEGTAPDENDEAAAVRQFRALGKTTAYLHRQTEIWNGTTSLDRWHWTYETILGDSAIWGDWRAMPGLSAANVEQFSRCCDVIRRRLERYGRNEHNYGLIHADLRVANLLVEGEQIKVIDFDDCGFGWYLHDLASALSFIETKPVVPDLVNAWLDGYREVMPFTDTDFMEIDTFIMMRRLQLMAWIGSHLDSDPVRELADGFIDGTVELADRYLKLFG